MNGKNEPYKRVAQLLELVDDARSGLDLNVKKVMKRLGVQRAAASRYIKLVKEHVSTASRHVGGHKVHRAVDATEQLFEQALALELAAAAVPWLRGTRCHQQLRDLAVTTKAGLASDHQDALARVVGSFSIKRRGSPSAKRHAVALETLLGAIRKREHCRLHYTKLDGRDRDYDIEPWSLCLVHDALFLIGRKLPDGVVRTFELSHVATVVGLGTHFTSPTQDEGDSAALLKDSIGTYATDFGEVESVVLRVRESSHITLVRRPLHATQTLREVDAQGWATVHLSVIVCPDLIAAVLALLPHVRVVEPRSLRVAVQDAARVVTGSEWDP